VHKVCLNSSFLSPSLCSFSCFFQSKLQIPIYLWKVKQNLREIQFQRGKTNQWKNIDWIKQKRWNWFLIWLQNMSLCLLLKIQFTDYQFKKVDIYKSFRFYIRPVFITFSLYHAYFDDSFYIALDWHVFLAMGSLLF